jgi:energy-coupling factor transport system ATP-binding protein
VPIAFEKVNFKYAPNTPFAYEALKNVDLAFEMGKITAIIGPTGSGKSTLVQHLNALLLPTEGTVLVLDRTITNKHKPKELKSLRQKVGLVFQFPEYQLFEETILRDIMFGPLNFKVPEEKAKVLAMNALKLVGLDESFAEKSPLDISGGQKRRVAIAGILAIDPDVLVLDEPTAGLDPQGSKAMMELFVKLNKDSGKTILIVTHDMEHVINYCDNVVVMREGEVINHQRVTDYFERKTQVEDIHMSLPLLLGIKEMLIDGEFELKQPMRTIEDLAKAIAMEIKP